MVAVSGADRHGKCMISINPRVDMEHQHAHPTQKTYTKYFDSSNFRVPNRNIDGDEHFHCHTTISMIFWFDPIVLDAKFASTTTMVVSDGEGNGTYVVSCSGGGPMAKPDENHATPAMIMHQVWIFDLTPSF